MMYVENAVRLTWYTAVGLKTEGLGGSTRERKFSFQTELSIDVSFLLL